MKLLIISSLSQAPGSDYYAPVENQAACIAIGLKGLGHEISVVALPGQTWPEGVELIAAADGDEEKAYNSYKEKLKDFDCILDFSVLKYPYLMKRDEKKDLKVIAAVYPYQGQGYGTAPPVPCPCFVGTSDAHAQSLSLKFGVAARSVYYGIHANTPKVEMGDRMLYLGRFIKEKGPQVAIDVAHQLRMGLDLAGEDVAVPDPRFLIQLLQRCDGRLVRSYGRVKESTKGELLSKAKCAILPYLSDDVAYTCIPAIEALAHGIPVVALRRGAIGEIVKDGINGILCTRMDQLPEAVKRVDEISTEACLESAKAFTIDGAVAAYNNLVSEAVEGREW